MLQSLARPDAFLVEPSSHSLLMAGTEEINEATLRIQRETLQSTARAKEDLLEAGEYARNAHSTAVAQSEQLAAVHRSAEEAAANVETAKTKTKKLLRKVAANKLITILLVLVILAVVACCVVAAVKKSPNKPA